MDLKAIPKTIILEIPVYNPQIKFSYLDIMTVKIFVIAATILMLTLITTTNASNAAGNMAASANQTASELGQNASQVRGEILNKTWEAAQKIGVRAANVLGNITQEIKEGVNASK